MNNTTTQSHGMGLLIEALKKAKKTNDLTIYFNWLTDNRLSARPGGTWILACCGQDSHQVS